MQRRQRGSVRDIDFEDTDDNKDTVATLSCKEINIAWDDWSAPPMIPPAPSPRRLGGRAANFQLSRARPQNSSRAGAGRGLVRVPQAFTISFSSALTRDNALAHVSVL